MHLKHLTTKLAGASIGIMALSATSIAQDMPGEGVAVRPAASTIAEENF
jgi:hypothetical protein